MKQDIEQLRTQANELTPSELTVERMKMVALLRIALALEELLAIAKRESGA